jgi:hypothetical protein
MARITLRNCKARIAIVVALAVLLAWARPDVVSSQDKKKDDNDALMKQWEKDVREQMEKTASLKALTGKYPLVLLQSRSLYDMEYLRWGYDFVLETSDLSKAKDAHVAFHNGSFPCGFDFNHSSHDSNLVVDLGKADFSKDPDPLKITIDDPAVLSRSVKKAVVGHIYLERIHDDWGNHFYVLFQIVAVDKDSRYMAFVWRRVPGGKIVKERPFGR